MKPATIRDVADAAAVSVAAVSRVLNDGPVAEATRARVLDAIERLDYRPRTAARELRAARPSTLGLVLADLANPFFAQLADRIVWEARARGAQVVLLTTREDARFEDEAIQALSSRRVAGVIATPTAANSPAWSRLAELGTRLVFVDRAVEGVAADRVGIENEATSTFGKQAHERPGRCSVAEARPEHEGLQPFVFKQRRKVPATADFLQHHGGQVRGIGRKRIGRRQQGDEASPGAKACGGGEARRAG